MPNLFPIFEVPKVIEKNQKADKRQKSSLYFDFEKGDFALDSAGKIQTAEPYDAWVQWCLKTVYTQRYAFLAYSNQVGVEMEEAFQQPSREEQESNIEVTVTEALLADPYQRTKRVYDFLFEWETDGLKVIFTVSGIWDRNTVLTANFKKKL